MTGTPDEKRAAAILARATGWGPATITRFPTGSAHYVFDIVADDGERAVLRMGLANQRDEMEAGLALLLALAERGVPVPRILASDVDDNLPWVLMERLPGTDLSHVVANLSEAQLISIARAVADAQAKVARFPSAGYYGYAADPKLAPHERWSGVVRASIERTRQRMAAAGLFDTAIADRLLELLERHGPALATIPATPFLHDTTIKNVIVAPNGTFSGIVDVDDFCFGDPRWAPALTKAALIAHGRSTFYAGAWMDAAGHADDELFEFYVAVFLGDLMAEHGQIFNGNEVASTPEQRAHLLAAFEDALGL